MSLTDREQSDLADFLRERDQALINLAETYVASRLPKAPPEMRLVILHKSRYEVTSISRELRLESGKWLAARGHKRMTGDELLPEGELPE